MTTRQSIKGFTLPEVVTVMVIIGIMAAFALPRFFQTSSFEARGFTAEARSALAFAQKLAIGSGCDIRVRFTPGGYSIEQWPVCNPNDHSTATTPVPAPGGGTLVGQNPDGVTVGAANFYFDRIGRPRQADATGLLVSAPIQVQIGDRTLQVQPDTGYSREL